MRIALLPLWCFVATAMSSSAAWATDGYVLVQQVPQAVAVDTVSQRVSRIASREAGNSAASLPECNRPVSVDWRNADHAAVAVECPQQWRAMVWVALPSRSLREDCTAAAWRACLSKHDDSRRSRKDPIRPATFAAAMTDANSR